jgi:uncharacterized protein YjaG (DUF416 family)
MNLAQKKSLELMDEFFNNLSVDDFLADYLEVEDFDGVTVDQFIAYSKAVAVLPVSKPVVVMADFYHTVLTKSGITHACKIDLGEIQTIKVTSYSGRSFADSSFSQSANDSLYNLAA